MRLIIAAIIAIILISGCVGPSPRDVGVNGGINGYQSFAIDFYNSIESGENVLVSPYSLYRALGVLYLGATGDVKEEIGNILRLSQGLFKANMPKGVVYLEANSIWINDRFNVNKDFIERARDEFSVDVHDINVLDPVGSASKINGWVREKTFNKINNLISPSAIDDSTALVIVNAIYFKGEWEKGFNKSLTVNDTFHGISGDERVEFMRAFDREEVFFENEDVKALRLYYKNNASMLFIMRKDGGLVNVSKEMIEDILKNGREVEVSEIKIPKFHIEKSYNLKGPLTSMGLGGMFCPHEDFRGINENGHLCVTTVVQKTYIDVNEEGTEAAAATGIIVGITSMPVEDNKKTFIANHPFAFAILDRDGNILFVGDVKEFGE